MTTISVIIGSTRQGRFTEKPAKRILRHLQNRAGIEASLLDLRDFPMPFFDQPAPPAMDRRRFTRAMPRFGQRVPSFETTRVLWESLATIFTASNAARPSSHGRVSVPPPP